jgi:hypothetical protein
LLQRRLRNDRVAQVEAEQPVRITGIPMANSHG